MDPDHRPAARSPALADADSGRIAKSDGPGFNDVKCSDHRRFSLVMTCFTALAGTSLWMWDHTIDPAAASVTIWIRALIVPNALVYIHALYVGANARWTSAAAAVMILGWEVGFIVASSLLKDGVIYGQAGFVFFFIMPLLVTRGFRSPSTSCWSS